MKCTDTDTDTDTVVIGGGQAGLAMSCCLRERGVKHVVLERGRVGERWRNGSWDSLRLLTPNWQSRLPGYRYEGPDPDGFMSMPEVIDFIDGYASVVAAPVRGQTNVEPVEPVAGGYRVVTDQGDWQARTVVLASGACNIPQTPAFAEAIPGDIATVTPKDYRNADALPAGGVLVVGASATGLQLADEIHASGRPVTLAVGEHVRMPRVYRGLDIQWWMDAVGLLDEGIDDVDDINRARRVPSPQLIGTLERATLDLNALTSRGVDLVGRLMGVRDATAQFSGSLRNVCALADLKQGRLLDTIDEWAASAEHPAVEPPQRFAATAVEKSPPLTLDLNSGKIRSIVWATGYRPDYSWLQVPVLDRKGRLRHDQGVVDAPGLYALGLTFLRRRKSSFIHGAEDDVRDLGVHLHGYLDSLSATVASRSVRSP